MRGLQKTSTLNIHYTIQRTNPMINGMLIQEGLDTQYGGRCD